MLPMSQSLPASAGEGQHRWKVQDRWDSRCWWCRGPLRSKGTRLYPHGTVCTAGGEILGETPHGLQNHGHNMLRSSNTLNTLQGKAQTKKKKIWRYLSQEQEIPVSIRRMKTGGCPGFLTSHFRSSVCCLGCLTPLSFKCSHLVSAALLPGFDSLLHSASLALLGDVSALFFFP